MFVIRLLFACWALTTPLTAANPDAHVKDVPNASPALYGAGTFSRAFNEREPSFSPDGGQAVFWLLLGHHGIILHTQRKGGRWSPPRPVPFSGQHSDFEPVFSPDGKSVYFVSDRPRRVSASQSNSDIWVVTREDEGWGEPRVLDGRVNGLGIEFFPSICQNGVLYFNRVAADFSRSDLVRVDLGTTDPATTVAGILDDAELGANVLVSPDERFLIIPKIMPLLGGARHLHICFRNKDGGWGEPKPLLPADVLLADDDGMRLSPDGRALYFSRAWVPSQPGIWGRPLTLPRNKTLQAEDLIQFQAGPQNGLKDVYFVDISQHTKP